MFQEFNIHIFQILLAGIPKVKQDKRMGQQDNPLFAYCKHPHVNES